MKALIFTVGNYVTDPESLEKLKARFKPDTDYIQIGDNRLYFPEHDCWFSAYPNSANTDQS